MRYQIDHDFHIHTCLSRCSKDLHQRPERILQYGLENGFHTLCLTDHYWDERVPGADFHGEYKCGAAIWYALQNTAHTDMALPLPQAEGIRFLYGCETEMDKHFTIGISRAEVERRAFIIVPTTHLHMKNFSVDEADRTEEKCAELWVKRFQALLDSGLPLQKVGIAHLTTALFVPNGDWDGVERCLSMISDDDMKHLFGQAAKAGLGIELNFEPTACAAVIESVLRPYKIAAECGCKFYLGSDAHTESGLNCAVSKFEKMIDLLGLTEDQKFKI